MRLISSGPAQTQALGAALGELLCGGDVICLAGALAAGKTCFSRGIGIGWGAIPPLTSPSYNLMHEHSRQADGARLCHLDFYRLSGAREAELLGFDDILASGAALIFEWPQRLESLLPPQRLWIDFEPRSTAQRLLHFAACGARHRGLLRDFGRRVDERGLC